MQLTEFKREFDEARWGADAIVCIVAAISLPLIIRLLTFPLEAAPLNFPLVFTGVIGITIIYLLGSALGKWVIRTRFKSYIWIPVTGSLLYAIVKVTLALPSVIEYHSRFHSDEMLLVYLVNDLTPGFIFTVVVFGGYSLIATMVFRFLFAVFRSGLQRVKFMP